MGIAIDFAATSNYIDLSQDPSLDYLIFGVGQT